MDNYLPDLGTEVASIYQDFKMDIYHALLEGIYRLKNYDKLILVFPIKVVYPYPQEILQRSEEHTSELQSRENLVCRLLLEKKKYDLSTSLPISYSHSCIL